MATLSIVHGFLGAGKSTFSRQLAQQTGAVRLNADEYCEATFTPAQLEKDWNTCFSQSINALWQKAEELTGQGADVILDFGFWDAASRHDARQRAAAMGATFKHYYVHAPKAVLLQRIAQRGGPIAQSNLTNFDALWQQFQPPQAAEEAIFINTEAPMSAK